MGGETPFLGGGRGGGDEEGEPLGRKELGELLLVVGTGSGDKNRRACRMAR